MKRYLILLLSVLCIVSLGGCKKEKEKETNISGEQNIEKEEVQEEIVEDTIEETIPENQNLLTGITDLSDEAIGKRPVAVMVNNVNAALPQYGIAQADIIFEMNVEGDLTRLMALYSDYTKVPKVCAIRSCRAYFPAVSEGFDAIYIHWGMDESMRSYVEAIDSTRYDAMKNGSGMFGRDQNRIDSGYSKEHTAYFDGTMLASVMESQGERTELLEDKKQTAFLFNNMNEQVKPEGESCSIVNIDFGAATAKFTYDETSNTYLKQINGKNQMDSVAGTQLSFTNVFVLETSVTTREDGVHKSIDWSGGSSAVGYYISNGAVQKIHWSKSSEKDYLKFWNENGEELSINCGKSYIAFNRSSQTTFE